MTYTTVNNLADHIKQKAKQERKLQKDIEQDIADYCGASRDTIISIKHNRVGVSLQLALKICEYFGTSVESMFKLKEE